MKMVAKTKAVVTVKARSPVQVRQQPHALSRHTAQILQPALKVGAANDPLEREAENTAERIVSMPSPDVAPPLTNPSPDGNGLSRRALVLRATMDDQPDTDTLETAPPIPADHQDPDVPKEEDVDTTELSINDMKEIESGQPEDTAGEPPAEEAPPPAEDEAGAPAAAQAARTGDEAVVGAEGGAAPADVSSRVNQPGSGRPLPASVRSFMEPRFGKDFSDVRIHDGPDDRKAAHRIGARAFTHRQHIWMGPGERVENRRLLAHELTHVVQQTKRNPIPLIKREVDTSEDLGEPEVRRGYIRNKAEKYARKVPGYRLVSVIIGKSPITGNKVDFNATNLLGALMSMIPGGGELFDRLMETRVIQNAFDWIKGRLNKLKITWARIKGLISDLIDYLPARPSNAVRKAKSLFAPIVSDIITFIGEVKDKILEFIIRGALKLAGPWADKVWGVIKKAGSVISTILKDPLGFAKNLFNAVLLGFKQFGSNILTHIKKGLLGWLFGAIKGLDIQIPEKLDFKGLISIALQIVGLTYANFRVKLVERLGANGERKVAYLEKSVEIVKTLLKDGFVGMWQRVLEMIDNFKQTMIGGIRDFVTNSLIMGGLSWLAGLSNPAGAVVKVVLAIYNMIKTFLERLNQILEVANSIFSSIGSIVAGKIQDAANFIEKTMAATIPVVISFLAALVPISGITNSIRKIIKKLKAPVDNAIKKMITFLVKKAKKLFSKLIGKLNKKRRLPSANFKVGKAQHRIFAEKKGKSIRVMVASGKAKPVGEVGTATRAEVKKLQGEDAKKTGSNISGQVTDADNETKNAAKSIKPTAKNANMNKPTKKLKEEIEEAAKETEAASKDAAINPEVNEQDGYDGPLFRFKEPRDPKIEGKAGTYKELREIVKKSENSTKRSGGSFYEVDHIIEKQIPKAILENLGMLGTTKKPEGAMDVYRTADRKSKAKGKTVAEKQTEGVKSFSKIGKGDYSKISDDASQFPAVILYRPNHRDAGSVSNSRVLGWIKESSKTDNPQKTMRGLLRSQITVERKNVIEAYKQDKDTPVAIGKNINASLQEMQKRNSVIYGLRDQKGEKVGDASVKNKAAESKSKLAFDSKSGDKPDFDSIEGKYDTYSNLESNFGKYLEKDHIVEKSYPLRAKNLTFGSSSIWEQIESAVPESQANLTKDEINTRKEKLRDEKIYPSGGVQNYTEADGKAMLMYRPVHRAVSAKTGGAKSDEDILPKGKAPTISDSAKSYMMNGEDSELDKIRNAVRTAVKGNVSGITRVHASAVENEYASEDKNVKDANEGAEAKARAAAEMQKIIANVKGNLTKARSYTDNLFS